MLEYLYIHLHSILVILHGEISILMIILLAFSYLNLRTIVQIEVLNVYNFCYSKEVWPRKRKLHTNT